MGTLYKMCFCLYWLISLAQEQLQIGTDMLLFITSTGDELFNGINIDDIK